MNILVLSWEVPATSSMPGSPRLYNICRTLASRHVLTLATFSSSATRAAALASDAEAAAVFREVVVLPWPSRPVSWGRAQLHRLRQEAHFTMRSRDPAYHDQTCRRIAALAATSAADVVYADGLLVAQYMDRGRAPIPAIIDLHDCLTLGFARRAQRERHWLRKLQLQAEALSVARCERALHHTFSTVITNSAVDEQYLRSVAPAARTTTIGNGVDSDYFAPAAGAVPDDAPLPPTLVFTGVMNYGPNEDAAVYFCDAVLPLIRARRPEVSFVIVGKDPTDAVRRLGERPGVRIAGSVPDVRPYMREAGVIVCPLRYGTGIKNKLLAALAMEKPVVASSISTEGLELEDGRELLVADEPGAIADRVLRLLDDPRAARALGRRGRAVVTARYSWESSALAIEAALHDAVKQARTWAGTPSPAGAASVPARP